MNTLNYLFLPIIVICLIGCEQEKSEKIISPDVESYIKSLKTNQLDLISFPEFTHEDISELLEYRNDTQIITGFPNNPVSSLFLPECKLGMYVLWTVESIRAVAIDSEFLIMRFPSQNPILAFRDSVEMRLVSDELSHTIAAEAYQKWWEDNSNKNFDEFKNTDPLENTAYKWH